MKCKYRKGGEIPSRHGSIKIEPHTGNMKKKTVMGKTFWQCPECCHAEEDRSEYTTCTFVQHAPYKAYGRSGWGVIVNGEEVPLADRRLLRLMPLRQEVFGKQDYDVLTKYVPALTDATLAQQVIDARPKSFTCNY